MLVKAVALSLVLGGVGFAANDALAAGPIPGMPSETDIMKANISANAQKILQNQKDIAGLKGDVATNKDNITTNKAIATKAYGMAQTEQVERKIADTQIREDMKKADKELSDKIDKETSDRKFGEFKLNTKIDAEGQARVENDKLLNNKIDAETDARVDADKKLNAKIDSNAAKVQEQLDAQDNKNKAQDESIKANGAAIKANKDAIKANADAIKANKAEADEQHKYLNSRVENNTANIDKNKVAIENEVKAREDADKKLDQKITDEAKAREDADKAEATTRANEDKRIEAKFDGEVSRLDGRIDKLNDNVEKVGAMAAAIANLHTMGYDPEAPTEIAVGVGQYRDKTGLALGAFHYPNRNFMLSFSVSTAGDEFMGGIGATWKFGHKSPEKLRQAEVEKAAKAKLAKAEAAKKAAKDARVAAQQKRHAEMLAARTGK